MKKNIIIFWIVASGLSVMALLKGVPYAGIALLISSIGLGVYVAVPLFWYLFRTEEVEIDGEIIELEHRDIMPSVDSPGTSYSWMKVETSEGVLQSVRLNYSLFYRLNEKFKQSKGKMHVTLHCVKWIIFDQITAQDLLHPL